MPDFFQKVSDSDLEGGRESLAERIPGIGELLKRAELREADDLLRQELVRAFRSTMADFDRVKHEIIDEYGLEFMERVQAIDTKMSSLIDKIETAADGYSGLFARDKVNSSSLERAYAFDQALFLYQEQFASGVKELGDTISDGDIKAVLRDLDKVVTEANKLFSGRVEVLRGLASGE